MKKIELQLFEKDQISKLPENPKINRSFRIGCVVKIGINVSEGTSVRVQYFEGICISIKNGKNISYNSSFTVRKINSKGEGYSSEKTFLYYSPNISSIEIISEGKVRRAKLFFLRKKQGKSARIKTVLKKKA